jgi:hypothetical protein
VKTNSKHVTPTITSPHVKKAKNLPAIIFALVIDLEKTINSVPSSFWSLNITTAAEAQINAKIIIVYDLRSIRLLDQIEKGDNFIVKGITKRIKEKNSQ